MQTIRIIPNQLFRDGNITYSPNKEYDVDRDNGVYFVRCGWAASPDYTPPSGSSQPAVVDIQPNNIIHSTMVTEV